MGHIQNKHNIIKSCKLSAGIYHGRPFYYKQNGSLTIKHYSSPSPTPQTTKQSSHAILLKDKYNSLTVVFSGSQSIQDLLVATDAACVSFSHDVSSAPTTSLYCHKGFMKRYISLHWDLMDDILSHTNNNTSFTLTGHSMGGAMAAYCAFTLIRDNHELAKNINLHTFGAPRMSNNEFHKFLKDNIHEYYPFELDNDIIPMLCFNKEFGEPNPYSIMLKSSHMMHNVLQNHSCISYVNALKTYIK